MKHKISRQDIQDALIIFFCEGKQIQKLKPEIRESRTYVSMKTHGSSAYELTDDEIRVGVYA